MKTYRATQKLMKGDRVIKPGEFIGNIFTQKEIDQFIKEGKAALKIGGKQDKPPKPKKGKDKKGEKVTDDKNP